MRLAAFVVSIQILVGCTAVLLLFWWETSPRKTLFLLALLAATIAGFFVLAAINRNVEKRLNELEAQNRRER